MPRKQQIQRSGLDGLAKLRAGTLVEQAYEALRTAIMSGKFPPGESLSIRTLAKAMGTSAMPIRDSMQRLAAEGALRLEQNRVFRVPVLTRQEFEDVWEMRRMIEPLAAARAARGATPEEVAASEEHFARLERALRVGAPDVILEENRLFHFGIYKASRSTQIINVIEILWLRSGPLLSLLLNTSNPERDARLREIHHHRRLIKAIRSASSSAARAATRSILIDSANWYRTHCSFSA